MNSNETMEKGGADIKVVFLPVYVYVCDPITFI